MTEYRRIYVPNATWFFTVNLAVRNNNSLLVENILLLRECFRYIKQQKPFHINAIVILPDHLHCIWTLPPDDSNYSIRWNMLKGRFSRAIVKGEKISSSRINRRERGIWQRRFWVHLIMNQEDYNRHVDYIHWNPVKHGLVNQVIDWPYSSFHQFVEQGIYPAAWGIQGNLRWMAVNNASDTRRAQVRLLASAHPMLRILWPCHFYRNPWGRDCP